MDGEIRIVRGVPTDEELAAIVGVLLAARSTAARPAPAPPVSSRWTRSGRPGYALPDGRVTRRAAGSWRASGLPR